jgi:hypothetical protein
MSLNIIIRDKRSEKERTIEERGKGMMEHFYKRECRGEYREDWCKVTKAEAKKAWEHDARGDIDPAL